MALRADQVLIGVVALIGVGAAYLLARPTRSRPAPIPPAPDVPILAATPIPFPQNLVRSPGRATLRTGGVYRGRLEGAPGMGALEVESALRFAGFQPTEIALRAADVADWLPQLTAGATGGTRLFVARWRGASGASVAIDPRLSAIVPTADMGASPRPPAQLTPIGAARYW